MSNFHHDFYKSKSPQKYQPSKKSGGNNTDFCTIHSEQKTIFCLSSECVTKLCQSCVMFHSQIHKQNGTEPAFETIENTQAINSEKADYLVGFYRENLEKLQNPKNTQQFVTFYMDFRHLSWIKTCLRHSLGAIFVDEMKSKDEKMTKLEHPKVNIFEQNAK